MEILKKLCAGSKQHNLKQQNIVPELGVRQLWLVKYWFYCLAAGFILGFCSSFTVSLAEDEAVNGTDEVVDASLLEEIEQGLLSQDPKAEPAKIERKDLPKLEDKRKESISSEIDVPLETGSFSFKKTAKIIVLNKITAKSELTEFKLGMIKFFGNLSIEVHKCVRNADPVRSANLVLITVFDNKLDNDKLLVFHGWMDSSNLSISTLEHPVYELIPVDCVN